MTQVPATNCAGHLDIEPNQLTVHFDSVKRSTMKVNFLDLERIVKSGTSGQVGGVTVHMVRSFKIMRMLNRWNVRVPKPIEVHLQLHQPVQGSDLMVVDRQALLYALQNVS